MMLTRRLYSEVGGVRLLTKLPARVTLSWMSASFRVLAVMTACLLINSSIASADAIANSVTETKAKPQKVRLAAVLALSKSKDPRAVLAVSSSLTRDADHNIRRVAALALEKMIDRKTAEDARELALDALERSSKNDRDLKVMETSARVYKALANLRSSKAGSGGNDSSGRPAVFVNIDAAVDQSKKAPKDAPDRLAKIVRKSIERTGYSTSWPGGLPSSRDLTKSKSQAYIVASTVKAIEVTKGSRQTTIACTVAIRVSPWSGKDGGEKWEAHKSASASGSAKAMTGNSANAISSGMRDCIDAVTEDVTNRQVVPFLKRVAQAGT
jgi:hypothetical protein